MNICVHVCVVSVKSYRLAGSRDEKSLLACMHKLVFQVHREDKLIKFFSRVIFADSRYSLHKGLHWA